MVLVPLIKIVRENAFNVKTSIKHQNLSRAIQVWVMTLGLGIPALGYLVWEPLFKPLVRFLVTQKKKSHEFHQETLERKKIHEVARESSCVRTIYDGVSSRLFPVLFFIINTLVIIRDMFLPVASCTRSAT